MGRAGFELQLHFLLLEVLEDERLAECGVALRFLERKSGGEEGNQGVADRPLLDWAVQDHLFWKESNLKLALAPACEGRQSSEDLHHRTATRFLLHGAHTDDERLF